VDTLRADALGAYGNPAAPTPWMDRLAAGGVLFTDAHAHNVVTLPSHANILSGRYPLDHGVRDNSGFRFPSRMDTLATLLRARGYRTGAFVSAFPLAGRFGLGRGFDVYDDSFVDAEARPAFLEQERAGTATVARARAWQEAAGGRPSFCWVHLYEPHYPYAPPEPYAARFRGDAYHGEVAAADAALEPLLAPLSATGEEGRTLVVLTADHGESLGEHGEATHGIFAYEATLRVPLILYAPRLLSPRVVSTPARHVDLLPTILDALALPTPEGLPGRSLLPAATGRSPGAPAPSYFEALAGQLNRGWAPLHGVIREGTKYVDLPIPELYDLPRDLREERNLARPEPQRRAEMQALLAPFLVPERGPRPQAESAETRERLRSLGYLTAAAGPPKTVYDEDDDPKRLIALDATLQEIVTLYSSGDLAGAIARCRDLVRRRPSMAVSLLSLAHLERQSGNLPAAVGALRKALALAPEDAVTAALLGATLTQAGQAREAAALLESYARREEPDVDVLVARGLALAKLGQNPDALSALVRAREIEPSNAMILVDVGTVHLMARDPSRARESFEAALALNPAVARAQSSLAFMAAETGQGAEALERFGKAIALDPRENEKLLALGLLLWQRGRRAEARPYLELFAASAPARYAREVERVRALLAASP
jgi:arylsulfatase A-like enzyme/Tfp pilus assembly protein PilF